MKAIEEDWIDAGHHAAGRRLRIGWRRNKRNQSGE